MPAGGCANARAEQPRLPARLHPSVRTLLEDHSSLIADLVAGLGSPLHLVLPQVFEHTARQFVRTLHDARVPGQVLFAKKANKARCFVQRCAALGLGIDVASAPELEQALAAGVRGEDIGVSGPSKSADLIELGLRRGCWLAMDGCGELSHVIELARSLGLRARVLLRRRSELPGQTHSRFGLTAAETEDALRLCVEHPAQLKLEGFSFHLTGYSASQRAGMAASLIEQCLAARARGLSCDTVDIGGGFAVCYVDPGDWERFSSATSATDFHANKTFSGFYPYGSLSVGPAMLAEILATKVRGGSSLSAELARHGLRVLLEPGRALLDQSGVTAFRIQGVKDRRASEGYSLLTAEGTSFSLSEQWFGSEFLPDPILLGSQSLERTDGEFIACVGGSSCLESDMLSWRKISFPRRVEVGDIVAYANTAGYQMDSNESPFHALPLPRKAVVTLTAGIARWRLDDVAAWNL